MFSIIIDPNDYYTDSNHHNIVSHCGVIINWAINPNYVKSSFKTAVLDQYLYGSDFCMGGDIDHDGVYRYPEDPPMHPLLKITRNDDVLYFYQHDIIAMSDKSQKSGFYITRVD